MIYFKHYSNASDSKSLNKIFDKYGHTGIAFWWMLLELCSEHWDGHSAPDFEFHQRTVATKLKSTPNRVRTWLELCSDLGMCAFGKNETQLMISIPKLLEVKSSRKVIKSNKKQLVVYKKEDKKEDKDRQKLQHSLPVDADKITQVSEDWNKLCEVLKNEHGIKISQVKIPLTEKRRKAVKIMLKELPSRDDWKKAMGMIPANKFNLGENERGWVANFDWFFSTTKQPYMKLYEDWFTANEN